MKGHNKKKKSGNSGKHETQYNMKDNPKNWEICKGMRIQGYQDEHNKTNTVSV